MEDIFKKRQRRSTSGTFDNLHNQPYYENVSKEGFKTLSTDDKLVTMIDMLTLTHSLATCVSNIEQHVHILLSHGEIINNRLKVLENKSIDVEARSRSQNMIFRGLQEVLQFENCENRIKTFFNETLEIDTCDTCIQKTHRPHVGKVSQL